MNQYFENNQKLKSELRILKYTYQDYKFNFYSDLGVFSKNKIDEGSRLLVETFFKYGEKNKNILDVGCGIGFIGITLNKIMNANVDMIDVNNRALHLTKMNITENKVKANVFYSNIYENIIKKYDVIITNPPIRAGKKVYLTILEESFNYLKENGELWFVMRTNHGVKTIIKNFKEMYKVDVLEKNVGFYVICVKK